MLKISEVNDGNIVEAGRIHSVSWCDSHKFFCTDEFVKLHSPERQTDYLREKINKGAKVWMLTDGVPVGVVSVTDGVIEDLYVLPEKQNRGYGTKLLEYAAANAGDKPTLWILENNKSAEKLYRRCGFYPTGRVNAITDKLSEIELMLLYDVRKSRICIPDMQDEVTLLHISDSHICVTDAETDEKEASYINQREEFWHTSKLGFARFYGERSHIGKAELSTGTAFERMLEYSELIGADAVVSTGDLMECMHGAGERFIKKSVSERNVTLIAAPGNHEEAVCKGIWNSDLQNFDYPSFRVVTVDDRLKSFSDVTIERFEALCREGKPIILALHIPLMTDSNRRSVLSRLEKYYTVDETDCDSSAKRFFEILRGYSAVKLVLCGHIHGYTDTVLFGNLHQISAPQGMVCGCHVLTVHGA